MSFADKNNDLFDIAMTDVDAWDDGDLEALIKDGAELDDETRAILD